MGKGGVDRDEEVFAAHLQAVTRKIDHGDRVRSRNRCLLNEIAQGVAQRVAVEIARPDHVKARGLQRLRDQAGVIRTCRKRALLRRCQ